MVKSARELNSYSLHHKGGFVLRLLEEGLNSESNIRGQHSFDHIYDNDETVNVKEIPI